MNVKILDLHMYLANIMFSYIISFYVGQGPIDYNIFVDLFGFKDGVSLLNVVLLLNTSLGPYYIFIDI